MGCGEGGGGQSPPFVSNTLQSRGLLSMEAQIELDFRSVGFVEVQ